MSIFIYITFLLTTGFNISNQQNNKLAQIDTGKLQNMLNQEVTEHGMPSGGEVLGYLASIFGRGGNPVDNILQEATLVMPELFEKEQEPVPVETPKTTIPLQNPPLKPPIIEEPSREENKEEDVKSEIFTLPEENVNDEEYSVVYAPSLWDRFFHRDSLVFYILGIGMPLMALGLGLLATFH